MVHTGLDQEQLYVYEVVAAQASLKMSLVLEMLHIIYHRGRHAFDVNH